MTHTATSLAVLAALMTVAVYWDVRFRRIPNVLALGIAAAGLLASLHAGGLRAAGAALLVGLGTGAFLFLVWTRGRIGAGDVKLAAAAAVWVGYEGLALFLLAGGLAGGLVSIACYALSAPRARSEIRANLVQAGLGGGLSSPASASVGRVSVPYAAAIALGVAVAFAVGR